MADIIKVLGQSNPAATTDTDIYVVPDGTSTVVSSIVICELNGGTPTFRIAVRPKGLAIANKHYLFYNRPLTANQTVVFTGGITLSQGDIIMVRASDVNVAFSVFGVETAREGR